MEMKQVSTEKDNVVVLTAMLASPSIVAFINEALELELIALGFWNDVEMQVTAAGRRFLSMQRIA